MPGVGGGADGAQVNAISPETAVIAAQVREAAGRRERLRIVGSGGWLDAGRPLKGATPLALDRASGIVEYVPGDLTLTARAGTTLAEIERLTGAEQQFLPLDPFGRPSATLGATIATASCGPLAHAFGTPRDVVLGVEAVMGNGAVIRGGGRVVKNVAGFDLTRLLTGAWGTLGVITEVSLRLRAMPEADETVAFGVRFDSPDGIAAMIARLSRAPLAPSAFELLSPGLAARLGVSAQTAVLLRIAGSTESVAAQRMALDEMTETFAAPSTIWRRLAESEPSDGAVIRLSARPSRVGHLWSAARQVTNTWSGAFAHASLGRGIVRLILPAADAARTLEVLRALDAREGHFVAERVPASCWAHPALAPRGDALLSKRLLDAFDPKRILNPGILGIES